MSQIIQKYVFSSDRNSFGNVLFVFLIMTLVCSNLIGCASGSSYRSTTSHETTTTQSTDADNIEENPSGEIMPSSEEDEVSQEKHKTTVVETKETRSQPQGGIISSTFHAIGYVIALPFTIIAGLIRMIF